MKISLVWKCNTLQPGLYTAKNMQFATSLLTSCNNLLQADIRMHLHDLRQLIANQSVACNQQTYAIWLSSLLPTGLLQDISTSCNKSSNDNLQQAWFLHTGHNLMKCHWQVATCWKNWQVATSLWRFLLCTSAQHRCWNRNGTLIQKWLDEQCTKHVRTMHHGPG